MQGVFTVRVTLVVALGDLVGRMSVRIAAVLTTVHNEEPSAHRDQATGIDTVVCCIAVTIAHTMCRQRLLLVYTSVVHVW
jgi:hypothetical protein